MAASTTTTTTQTSHALVVDRQTGLTLREIARPVPQSNQVLVKISHVAQNPTDVQSFDSNAFGEGAVYGCDFAGEVVEVGDSVSRVNKGDVIAGLIWGGEIRGLGAYSEYTLADERICFKIPQGISPDTASTLPLASATAWLSLFSKDCLDIERGRPQSVLIWGGSSSVGQYAIQLAKLEGLTVITTCSPKNSDMARTLGADHVFDYRSSDVVDQIKSVAPDLKYVFDTIGSKDSSEISSQAITGNGVLCTVRPGKANTEKVASNVKITDVLVWTSFLKEHRYGKFHWPANESDHKLSSELFDRIPGWLESGKLKPNPVLVLEGLESVSKGFELHRQGNISAKKIVYKL